MGISLRNKILLALVGTVGGVVAVAGLARLAFFIPPQVLDAAVTCPAEAPTISRKTPLRVLSWNIQYSAGRNHQFFYDRGNTVSVSGEAVHQTLEEIAAIIRQFNPDIVMLQEVDRNSRRTQYVDQHAELLQKLDYPCHSTTPYYRVPYVPFPSSEHLGRVDMHLTVLSRFQIDSVTRHQLPLLQESRLRQLFNLRRALMEIRLPISDGGEFLLFNTHLSAFTWGDGTLTRQIEVVDQTVEQAEDAGYPWMLAGDLNSLPPGDRPARLGVAEASKYSEDATPVQRLISRHGHPVSPKRYTSHGPAWYTYQPFGEVPDRTLDYMVFGSRVEMLTYTVAQAADGPSDHLPLLMELQVR
jgi:endonuclease/exonuclease/phosphatase family metal-dependent hydrolase